VYVLVAGGGKVGANVARTLLRLGHEVTLIDLLSSQTEALPADTVVIRTHGVPNDDLYFALQGRVPEVLRVGDAVAVHDGSRSIGRRAPARLYFASRNHLLVAARAAPAGPVRRLARAAAIVALNLAHAVVRAEAPLAAGVGAVLQGVWHHVRGRYGPRSA